MVLNDWEKRIRAALEKDVPYIGRSHTEALAPRAKVIERSGRHAAVLMALGFRAGGEEPELLLTRRADHLLMHAGQMAFPGGASDPEDHEEGRPSPVRTALRESREEVGLDPSAVRVLGSLPPLFTFSSDFWVTPVVALVDPAIERLPLVPNADEIATVLWVPLEELRGAHRTEPIEFGGKAYPTHVYQVQGQRVWGATAAMIHNFLERLGPPGATFL